MTRQFVDKDSRFRWFGFVEERCWVCWEQDAEDGVTRQGKNLKTIEEIYRCGEGRHVGSGVERNAEDRRWK